MPKIYTSNMKQRIKNVLLAITEDDNASVQEKIDAGKQLVEVIRLEDLRKYHLTRVNIHRKRTKAAKLKAQAEAEALAKAPPPPPPPPPPPVNLRPKTEVNALGI